MLTTRKANSEQDPVVSSFLKKRETRRSYHCLAQLCWVVPHCISGQRHLCSVRRNVPSISESALTSSV